jgi:hypothetical protein
MDDDLVTHLFVVEKPKSARSAHVGIVGWGRHKMDPDGMDVEVRVGSLPGCSGKGES